MPFDWKDYIDLAAELKTRSDEAAHRSAISRVYYGIFCLARNHIDDGAISLDYGDIHAKVWLMYKNKGGTHRSIGQQGERLRKSRNEADYQNDFGQLAQKLEESFILTRNILNYLSGIQKNQSKK